jgi:hypothetical protein
MANESSSLYGITKYDPNCSTDMFRDLDITRTKRFLKMLVVMNTSNIQKWLKYIQVQPLTSTYE